MSSGSTDPRRRGAAPASPQQLLADASWRRRHSLWLLGPILGVGMITWASFLYIGRKARRRDWLIAGCIYAVGTAVGFYFTDGTEGPGGKTSDWQGGYLVALWAVGVVHALMSRRAWLVWRAHNTVPWYEQQPATASPALAPTPSPELSALGVDPSQYYAAAPQPVVPTPPVPSAQPTAPVAPAAPLDVNTATDQQLTALPGITPERAGRAMAARAARGGFGSVEEFADAAGLAPHEHLRIRGLVTCVRAASPPPTVNPSGGRVVDF